MSTNLEPVDDGFLKGERVHGRDHELAPPRKRRLTGKAALSAWPARLATVKAEPTDENLQRLCALLDGIDSWVVQRWDKRGHDERLATLAECRRQAREANRLVSAALRKPSEARAAALAKARAGAAAKRTQQAPLSAPKRLTPGSGPTGTDGPAAA